MKSRFLKIILALTIVSCSSTSETTKKKPKSILKNDYVLINEDKLISIVDNDTILINEVKYEGVYSSFYIMKGMYDKFGSWDKIYKNDANKTILQWNNVKLFDNDTTQFKVAANAVENRETIYASVMVFDMNNNDLLSKNSIYKAKLIDYFSKMIRANKPNKTKFYRRYWQKVDPERWEEIRKYREKRIYSKDRKHQVYR